MRKGAAEAISTARRNVEGQIARGWRSLRAQQAARSTSKRLRVAATVSLGEKRFIAVIQVDGREFLVGGGATNVALLAPLNARESFDDLLTGEMKLPDMVAARNQPARRASKKAAMPVAALAVAKKQPAKRVSKPTGKSGVKPTAIASKQPAKRADKPIAKPAETKAAIGKQSAKPAGKPIAKKVIKPATIANEQPATRKSKPIAKPLAGQTGARA
jgi:flagellar biogenesis protein FliO